MVFPFLHVGGHFLFIGDAIQIDRLPHPYGKFCYLTRMPLLEPVVWAKGTFLNPQHLQIQDRYLEELLQFHMQSLNFRPWGFQRLRLNLDRLGEGIVSVSEASGIMPDGLLFEFPDSDQAPAQRSLADQFGPDEQTLDVYLTVPSYRERGMNVAGSQRGGEVRYRAEAVMMRDDTTGQSEKPVIFARKNFRLLISGENLEGSSCLRIARVNKTAGGRYELDPRFVPPLLDIRASEYLVSIARRLVELLSGRGNALSESRRQKNQSLADFGASDIASFWLLYTLNTHLPGFRHIFEASESHPEALFSSMLELAGALTTFSLKIHPRDLPVYDHNNLGICFGDLDEKVRLLLDTVVPANYVSLPLKLTQTSIYTTSLDKDQYLENTRLYLALNAETSASDLIGRVPGLVKICSIDYINHLVQNALPGVALTHVPNPPGAIPVKLNYKYFSLNLAGGAWEAIKRGRTVAAYVPGEFPNPNLELIILLPQPA